MLRFRVSSVFPNEYLFFSTNCAHVKQYWLPTHQCKHNRTLSKKKLEHMLSVSFNDPVITQTSIHRRLWHVHWLGWFHTCNVIHQTGSSLGTLRQGLANYAHWKQHPYFRVPNAVLGLSEKGINWTSTIRWTLLCAVVLRYTTFWYFLMIKFDLYHSQNFLMHTHERPCCFKSCAVLGMVWRIFLVLIVTERKIRNPTWPLWQLFICFNTGRWLLYL